VHLKTLTLKGFKSFASATTLHLEPGVTAVVGPNGSGKSNVVDALAWVMGEQGAKSLRGGKMEDVIFAGTAGRPPLGRAEVSLTIDNTDGALPIDYTEVTISRIMFRSGGSEYAINGSPCRLLDIQELLSDSGIGREMHVIVGQGQLDSVLHATPEDRRGFVEEAAGVLKHRKRKERALRKLAGLDDKLSRLHDLSVELRRQLKPLGRQAEVARRAVVIQTDLRDARLRLLADDYATATAALQREIADEEALLHRRSELESELLALQATEAGLVAEQESEAPVAAAAEEVWRRLTAVVERLRGTVRIAAERQSAAAEAPPPTPGRDPEQLRAQAAALEVEHQALADRIDGSAAVLRDVIAEREAVERAAEEARRAAAQRRRSAESARAALARATGRSAAAEAAVQARTGELEHARSSASSAVAALEAVRAEQPPAGPDRQPQSDVAALRAGADEAKRARQEAAAAVAAHRQSVQQAQRDQAAAAARSQTLQQALARADANGGTATVAEQVPGVLGGVADLVGVAPEHRVPVAAVLGAVAEGLVLDSPNAAVAALELLRRHGVDRAEFLIAGPGGPGRPGADDVRAAGRPPVGRWLADVVAGEGPAADAVAALLRGSVLVDDLDGAAQLLQELPSCTAVTKQGDVLAARWARGGVRDGSSRWELRDAVEQSAGEAEQARIRLAEAQRALAQALSAEQSSVEDAEAAAARLADARAAQAAHDERATQVARRLAAARSAADAATTRAAAIEEALGRQRRELASAQEALAIANADVAAHGTVEDDGREAELSEDLARLRQAETQARLALRTAEERAAALQQRITGLQQAARSQERAAAEAQQAYRRAQHRAAAAAQIRSVAEAGQAAASADLDQASARRADLAQRARARQSALGGLRGDLARVGAELARVTDSVHRDEVARAEQRLRIEQIAEKALADLGISPEVLVAEYGPQVPVPPSLVAPGDEEQAGVAEPYPYDRKEQERRLKSAERALALLGTVNPLALEEFAALEERHTYLNEQIEDVKRSRSDLLGIVKDVDDRVERVFAEAFQDTAAQFERVFARLFPGGEGRLVLTDPEDLLTTGVEVEARPPGKKIKRLSLLSGGERSLTAVAFLIALFKARPSPFYVLDEVEAALDDTNLGRLIEVIDELRTSSQLIVITHQKRTMEAADALYGVAMRGDGVTRVVSQRLRDQAGAAPEPLPPGAQLIDLRQTADA
jgi:chromosome segregation protein